MADTAAAPASAPSTPAPAAPATTPAAPAAPSSVLAPGSVAPPTNSSEGMRVAMAQAMVDAGKLTVEQARAELAGNGDPAAQPDASQSTETPKQVAKPQPDPMAGLDSDNAFDRMAAAQDIAHRVEGALQNLGDDAVDPGTAKFFGGALNKALRDPPSLQQRGAQAVATRQHLEQLHGKEQAQKIFDAARAEVRELEKSMPNLGELMDRSGASHDAYTLETLARRAFARAQRQLTAAYRK